MLSMLVAGRLAKDPQQIMQSQKAATCVRVSVATALLNRAYGRPLQQMEIIPGLPPKPVNTFECCV